MGGSTILCFVKMNGGHVVSSGIPTCDSLSHPRPPSPSRLFLGEKPTYKIACEHAFRAIRIFSPVALLFYIAKYRDHVSA